MNLYTAVVVATVCVTSPNKTDECEKLGAVYLSDVPYETVQTEETKARVCNKLKETTYHSITQSFKVLSQLSNSNEAKFEIRELDCILAAESFLINNLQENNNGENN